MNWYSEFTIKYKLGGLIERCTAAGSYMWHLSHRQICTSSKSILIGLHNNYV